MIFTEFLELMVLALGIAFVGEGVLFGMLWNTSRIVMRGRTRTRLSKGQHDLFFGLTFVSLAMGVLFILRWIEGPDAVVRINPEWVRFMLFAIMLGGLGVVGWAGPRVFRELINRQRSFEDADGGERREARQVATGKRQDATDIRQDATNIRQDIRETRLTGGDVFSAISLSLPIVVASREGIIRYTTTSLDELVGATDDELAGHNLTELMPAGFRPMHLAGLKRYLDTGESKIMGKVVAVELLRRDGTTTPVYLALSSATVDSVLWLIGALWERLEVLGTESTVETPEITAEEVT